MPKPALLPFPPVAGVRNLLLRTLPTDELGRLLAYLESVPLPLQEMLVKADEPAGALNFIESGTVSMLTTMEDGASVEVGLVGIEGFTGLSLVLGVPAEPLDGLVQVDGLGLRLPAAKLHQALAVAPSLLPVLLRYVASHHAQVAQTAACNGRHPIEQRLARWLLMTHDRVREEEFPMTQEFLSMMLGVRRPGVTLAMGALQRRGLVRTERGRVVMVDRLGLEKAACECYAVSRNRFAWLPLPPPGERDRTVR